MPAPILLPDVHKRSEATSRPQNLPRKHLSPEINTDQRGFEPPPPLAATASRAAPLVLWQKRGLPSQHPQKSHQPPQHPSTLKEKERPRHFRLLPHVGAEKLARAIQHTAVARNRAALATSSLVDTLADKQVAACIHSSHNAQSCKANGVSSRLKL